MGKKISLGAAVAVAGITAAVTVSLTYVYAMNSFNEKVADVNERQAMYTKLSEIDQKARQDYVGEINETQLTDGICAGYIAGLGDLQAQYMSAERYKTYQTGTAGKNTGVGIKTAMDEDGNMEVIQVMPNSPAEQSGIRKGDTIVSMDGREIVRITYGDALNRLDGTAGTTVTLGIYRAAQPTEAAAESENTVADGTDSSGTEPQGEYLEITVTRAEYTKQSITSSVINGNVGYIKISEFNDSSVEQFNSALSSLNKQKVAGLVIDLRNNSGGSVEAMASMLDTLLPAGNLVTTQDKNGQTTVEYTSKSNEIALPISVIANETTFGAAEIFAADIKEFKKGLVVGQPTAGYGTKDEVIPLSDGSAITLSVANYLTPGGTVFNGVGIAADISATLTEEQMDLLARDELAHTDDAQLQAAVSALVRQGAAVAEIPGTQSAQGTDAVPEEAGEGSATGEDAASSEGTQPTEEGSTSSSTAG